MSNRSTFIRITATVVLIAGVVAGCLILRRVFILRQLPLWTYFALFFAITAVCLAVWMLCTGLPPLWNLPPTLKSPITFFHPKVFFWESWKAMNREIPPEGNRKVGHEVIVVTLVTAFSLTLVEYFGGRATISRLWSEGVDGKYGDLVVFTWWSVTRFICYALIPAISVVATPGLKFRNCGLGFRGFFKHLWIYGVLFSIVLPVIVFASFKEDFKNYYPFYDYCGRSWFDLLAWEALYWTQFVSLEFLFRGYMIHPLKKYMGSYAIFLMVLPYCMIHYGKPYLEPNAAIVAGVVLGTLSLRTGSIWCGCLIHITVAITMDVAALAHKGGFAQLLEAGFFAP